MRFSSRDTLSQMHSIRTTGCMRNSMHVVKAVIVSHELAEPEHFDSYLARVLQPLVPLITFGRSAAAAPAVDPQFAVWHWWKDT